MPMLSRAARDAHVSFDFLYRHVVLGSSVATDNRTPTLLGLEFAVMSSSIVCRSGSLVPPVGGESQRSGGQEGMEREARGDSNRTPEAGVS